MLGHIHRPYCETRFQWHGMSHEMYINYNITLLLYVITFVGTFVEIHCLAKTVLTTNSDHVGFTSTEGSMTVYSCYNISYGIANIIVQVTSKKYVVIIFHQH